MLLAVPFGLLIGLIVGTVGGGGAILALPVLVYVLDEPVGPASTASLIVVALAASVGAGTQALRQNVDLRFAVTFSLPAAAGALLGTVLNHQVSARTLILAFVPLMAAAGIATWLRARGEQPADEPEPTSIPVVRVAVAGGLVGILTGFFGVGGGFVIVPVLTLWFGLGFHRAVGTSLVIIALTGVAALASHLAVGTSLDVPLTATLAGGTMLGALVGSLVSTRLPQRVLGQGFALVVGAVAFFLLLDALVLGGPPGS